ncbi:MAG: tetratricopeptide repeat protein, partial [Planctomycetaceae bacterium]|nr:tetratricopeptide repeat protein [Planctomycetaceae bacterium]
MKPLLAGTCALLRRGFAARTHRSGPSPWRLVATLLAAALSACPAADALAQPAASDPPPPATEAADAPARQYAAAVALQNRELYELAADEWTKFLERFPDDARASRARHYRGVCHLKDKRYEPAIVDFSEVIRRDPKFNLLPATYLNLGLAQYSQAQAGHPELFAPAAAAFATLVAKFPQSEYAPQATFYRGEALYAEGKKSEAAKVYDDFARKYPR